MARVVSKGRAEQIGCERIAHIASKSLILA